MQPEKYLARIGFHQPPRNDVATLKALHRAHLLSVPFENLDIVLKRNIVLEERSLFTKIVEGGRGGFCYELNALFAWLATRLGFEVRMIAAQVFKKDGTAGPPFDHMALLVEVEDEQYLADVSFGDSFLQPLKIFDQGRQVEEGRRVYQLVRSEAGFTLLSGSSADSDSLKPSFTFSLEPRQLSDFEEMCVYHQTSDLSHFTRNEICSIATETGRITLSGDQVIETIGGVRNVVELTSTEDKRQALAKYFRITL
ncbi:MAG: arylamine N-acetyltransferase family protein [Janthinobacterium lividum]